MLQVDRNFGGVNCLSRAQFQGYKYEKKMANRRLVQHLSSLEFFHRTNTLAIDLSPIQGRDNRPNRKEMFGFITKQLGLKEEEIVAIQHHAFVPQVFLKVQTEDILVKIWLICCLY